MRSGSSILATAVAVAAIVMAGCGGGGGGGSTGVTTGVVTKLGSVTVNGVKFQIQGARLRMPDDGIGKDNPIILTDTQTSLQEGMVVTIRGSFDDVTGSASDVEFMDNMEGVINEKGSNALNVMGQFVTVDSSTRIVDNGGNAIPFANLSTGRKVKVSGLPDDQGMLRATYIKQRTSAATPDQEFKGFVIGTPTATTFQLGLTPTALGTAMTVNSSGLTLPAGITTGAYVAVKSTVGFNSRNEFVAADVSLVSPLASEIDPPVATRVVEGYVSIGSVGAFVVSGQSVQTNAQTVFVNGTAADFARGKLVMVKGTVVNGVFTATTITFL